MDESSSLPVEETKPTAEKTLEVALCPDCDYVVEKKQLEPSHSAVCPRCSALIYRTPKVGFAGIFAFTLSGLLFFLPANTLPILTFSILGISSTNTMLNGVVRLFEDGYVWMSFMVFLCSVLAPLIDLLLLCFISLCMTKGWISPTLKRALLWQQKIQEWGMLEVYMLGILVAYIKMISMGMIIVGFGLFCYVGMLVSVMLAWSNFDVQYCFDEIERLENQKRGA